MQEMSARKAPMHAIIQLRNQSRELMGKLNQGDEQLSNSIQHTMEIFCRGELREKAIIKGCTNIASHSSIIRNGDLMTKSYDPRMHYRAKQTLATFAKERRVKPLRRNTGVDPSIRQLQSMGDVDSDFKQNEDSCNEMGYPQNEVIPYDDDDDNDDDDDDNDNDDNDNDDNDNNYDEVEEEEEEDAISTQLLSNTIPEGENILGSNSYSSGSGSGLGIQLGRYRNDTPSSVKRRRIIDQNIKVVCDDRLVDYAEEFEGERLLNHSYSDVNSVDEDGRDEHYGDDDGNNKGEEEKVEGSNKDEAAVEQEDIDEEEEDCVLDESVDSGSNSNEGDRLMCVESFPIETEKLEEDEKETSTKKTEDYSGQLNDMGNKKPTGKIVLTKTSLSKENKENLVNPRTKYGGRSQEDKLLGYDWIAGILDNNSYPSVELSDDYFDELKTFWKERQGQPLDDINLLKNFVDKSREPQLVQDILAESKIKSFRVNDRLFTEPVKKKSFSDLPTEQADNNDESKPSISSPRYVRISMPQNLLPNSPKTNKPHRRGSCDTTETLALGKHCVMGWEASRLGMLPTAAKIGIKHAIADQKIKETLTMEEAEGLAAGSIVIPTTKVLHDNTATGQFHHNYQHLLGLSSGRRSSIPLDSISKKKLASPFLQRVTNMSSNPPHQGSNTSLRSTSELLDSTYSLMRDMDRIKQEYEMKKLARQKLCVTP